MVDDLPKPNRTSTRTINVCLMNPGIMNVCSSTGINSPITNRKTVHLSIQSSLFMLSTIKLLKYFPSTIDMVFFRVLCFELIDFYTISIQKNVGCIAVYTQINFLS